MRLVVCDSSKASVGLLICSEPHTILNCIGQPGEDCQLPSLLGTYSFTLT